MKELLIMKRFIPKVFAGICLSSLSLLTFSCRKAFDVKPKDQVDITDNYRNVYDANAAVLGIYGKFLNLAEQYVILNELRADLMDVTPNADRYLQEISSHNVSADNPWADPRPFYSLILNCNDALKNFDIMVAQKKMTSTDYAQRYSDIASLRSWLYLQLGIHWGSVPYVTDALASVDDVKDTNKYPRIPFNQLLDKLINVVANLPYLDPYSTTTAITGATNTSLITNVDGYNTSYFFINKRCLLGDLYLWKGNYTSAATSYRNVLETGTNTLSSGSTGYYSMYKIPYGDVTTNNDNGVDYIRYRGQDINALVDNNTQGWRAMFARPEDSMFSYEWIWMMNFDKSFLPQDPFIDLFSNRGGRYLVKPSQLALDNWNSQTQSNGFPYDQRGRFTVRYLDGQPVIMKYLYTYLDPVTFTPTNPLQKTGRWFLYRAATLNLRFAEAANRDGYSKLAYAFVNRGIQAVFTDLNPDGSVPADVTNTMQTKYPAPYDFDARNGETPRYRAPWYQQIGTRTRASLPALDAGLENDMTGMENAIIDEAGLELAYEGQRWGDLERIALRRNDPSFLANKIYQKLLRDGNPNASTVQAKLMNPANWYLPFKL